MKKTYTTPSGEWIEDDLPILINATKVISYNVEYIVKDILEQREASEWVDSSGDSGGHPRSLEITLEDVTAWIEDHALEIFREMWGDENTQHLDMFLTDQDGNPV